MIVATAGLHGSASTWTFNVVRELAIAARGADGAIAGFADKIEQLPQGAGAPGCVTVLKSHVGSFDLDAWLVERDARLVINLRDPRDAALSMAMRFQAPLGRAMRWVMADAERILRLLARPHVLLRYETRFFELDDAVDTLADALGLAADPATRAAIAARYRPEAVRRFAAAIETLPPERIARGPNTVFDQETQYHATHIGDARSDKWRELPPETRAALTKACAPLLAKLGYDEEAGDLA